MKNIAVIGAGTMGNGIAHSFAQNGFNVNIVDTREDVLDNALKTIQHNLDRQVKKGLITAEIQLKTIALIKPFTSIEKAVQKADLVVEAVSEVPTLKQTIFQELDKHCPEACVLATNTSSISITQIASYTQRPDKVIGMHFMNPVPVMKLVEIIKGYSTSEETYQSVYDWTKALDKVPVVVNDYPGFIANRILMPMINEAIISVFEGVAGVVEIDSIMKLGMAHPMGPLQLADFIGLDTCLSIMKVMYDGFKNPKYAPCPLLVNMVQAGKLGVKSGEGFYSYAKGIKEAKVSERFR
ncbi:3-hydroxyacyl-CoA dehydrogenase family protein [Flectobacillus longus]|uniref:3-hydroxyacyl-CoA dehydrogenase family protein n=1 Tax=Flectobacillus longus TaxID=2984207 RepID=UPI0024B82EEB|nr:3-hydroxyacyl-CoA dehydrogenase NAD-binding domain-containing protein [Flectobacillus longus]MDI9879729.1 3-hydroxyacyl-CoA dehydrogenase NAD-binding domain-containing protein [Flectobacillus longus]